MKISKFPVMSQMGNEYLVKIVKVQDEHICTVYKKVPFLMNRLRNKKVYSVSSFWFKYFVGEFNHIAFAKKVVEAYEDKIKQEDDRDMAERKSLQEFLFWDGRC
jgi:hypothetical protein